MAISTWEKVMDTKAIVGMLLALACAAGCSRHHDAEMGPAQTAGKAVDDAGAKVADELHKPIDKANEAAQAIAQSADQTREQIKDATDDARAGLDKATEEAGKKVERAGEKMQDAAGK
jgi:hypothetical protein